MRGRQKGFTLLELIVVIAILSVVALTVFPRLPFSDEFAFDSEARRIAGVVRYLDESAVQKKQYYRLKFYPDRESFVVESSQDGAEFREEKEGFFGADTLKNGIELEDIAVADLDRITEGEAMVIFNPTFGAEPFNVHLKARERELTVTYNPYSGRVSILEGYV
ncbi:MAG: type II secretion system protein [Deltaproteobacteria bacterium]|nr:type II secretion system protein [Deltaproteobacteria bacterium]